MSACPQASTLLNPMCYVALGVPVTDSSWGYFRPLSTVWAFLTGGCWLEWLEQLEWYGLTAWWHGWQSEVRGGDRWATVPHRGTLGRDSGQCNITVIACGSDCFSFNSPGITQNCFDLLWLYKGKMLLKLLLQDDKQDLRWMELY